MSAVASTALSGTNRAVSFARETSLFKKKKRNKPKQNNIITSPRKLPMLYPFEDIVSKDISDTSTEYDNFQHHNSQ